LSDLTAVLGKVVEQLAPRASAIFVRDPPLDPDLADTSDLDLLVLGSEPGILPERMIVQRPGAGVQMVDLIWLEESLSDPEKLAANGLMAHRMAGSTALFDRTGMAGRLPYAVRACMLRPDVQELRLKGFFEMGFLTVREVGVTWDFPGLALFWVLVAHLACLAAMVDALGGLCPNVYTRPFTYLPFLKSRSGLSLAEKLDAVTLLDGSLEEIAAAVARIQRVLSTRFPEPDWPANIRQATRYEYRYYLAKEETAWRIQAAEEMRRRGMPAAAVIYLRFLAYSLARLPMVHHCALKGLDVSFIRPERAVRPQLMQLCPEILPDLELIFGGRDRVSVQQVQQSLAGLADLRSQAEVVILSKGFVLGDLRHWEPYQAGG
jgi:hypothetical protein